MTDQVGHSPSPKPADTVGTKAPDARPARADIAPPARRSQATRREHAESKLIEAALRLVGERGTTGMTLAEVGERAGFSRSLPAFYFGTKQELVRRLLEHIHQQHAAERDSQPRRAGLDAIFGVIDVYFIRRDPSRTTTRALFALMAEALNASSELTAPVARYLHDARGFLETQIRTGIEQREIAADIDPRLAAELILGGLRGTMLQWLISPSQFTLTDARDQMRVLVERALMAKAPATADLESTGDHNDVRSRPA